MLQNTPVTPHVKKTLLFHNVLVQEIKGTVGNTNSKKDKRISSKMFWLTQTISQDD